MGSEIKKFNVLVVDDHPFIRAIVKLTLEKGNFVVVAEAATGISAIRQAKRLKSDLMTLDISMPELDGLEVPHRLAELPKTLVLSSMTEDYYGVRLEKGKYPTLRLIFLVSVPGPV